MGRGSIFSPEIRRDKFEQEVTGMTDFNQKTHDTDAGSHGGQSRQMMEVFENQEFGSIRLLQEAGKTFFCASDVAKALGYVNPYAALKRHCRGPLTKREGVVQKVNQYGDAERKQNST